MAALAIPAAGAVFAAISAAVALTNSSFGGINVINNNDHAYEEAYTQNVVSHIREEYPNMNVMIVHSAHDQNFQGCTHVHYEFNLFGGRTQGYEVYVFLSGTFRLNGDGGFINWCYDGSFTKDSDDGHSLTFHQLPQPDPNDPSIYYLLNVQSSSGQMRSGIAYYKNRNNSANNWPDAYIDIKTDGDWTWENHLFSGTLANGDAVNGFVDGDAQAANHFDPVGYASSSIHGRWTVFKDDGRQLYNLKGWSGHPIYFMNAA